MLDAGNSEGNEDKNNKKPRKQSSRKDRYTQLFLDKRQAENKERKRLLSLRVI